MNRNASNLSPSCTRHDDQIKRHAPVHDRQKVRFDDQRPGIASPKPIGRSLYIGVREKNYAGDCANAKPRLAILHA